MRNDLRKEVKRNPNPQISSAQKDLGMNKTPKKYETPEKTLKKYETTPEKNTIRKEEKASENIKKTVKKYKYLFETQDYSPPKTKKKSPIKENQTKDKIKLYEYYKEE